ncbi:MAG: trypsin-like peptidase domain-containing protein [Chloroflexi bacterium]|nr:MAG: trypsin-like peptidase domain-containing protein [Chloroflexota bacterium]
MRVETPAEQLFFTTAIVEATGSDGSMWTGTGFLYAVSTDRGIVHFLVTNKHVLADTTEITLQFILDQDGQPAYGRAATARLAPFDVSRWFGHPNDAVDVAVIPFGEALNGMVAAGYRPFFRALPESLVPSPDVISGFDAMERVTFIGYPAGLFDTANLTPIARQGFTATPIALDYEGLPQFVIDAAVFPGSSGSPVLLYDRGMVVDRSGNVTIGSRLYLLGVLAAVHHDEVEAEVGKAAHRLVARFEQLLGLGIVFKTRTIDEAVDLALNKYGFSRAHSQLEPAPQPAPPGGTPADQEIARDT